MYRMKGFLSEDGKQITINNHNLYKISLRNLRGKEIDILIDGKEHEKASFKQFGYLFGYVYLEIQAWHFESTGEWQEVDEIHVLVLTKILQKKIKIITVNSKDYISIEFKIHLF